MGVAFSLLCPHQLIHTIIFSMSPSSSNLTVMVQRGPWLDLPSGPRCSLKYLPCSHFNPHFNTSSILGHYSESVCPACLSLRLVCVCESLAGRESDTGRMDTIVPRGHVGLWELLGMQSHWLVEKYSGCRNHPNQLLFLSGSSSLFMIVPSVFYLYHSAVSPSSFKPHRRRRLVICFSKWHRCLSLSL